MGVVESRNCAFSFVFSHDKHSSHLVNTQKVYIEWPKKGSSVNNQEQQIIGMNELLLKEAYVWLSMELDLHDSLIANICN